MLKSAKHNWLIITIDIVEHNTSEVIYSERQVHCRLWSKIVWVVCVMFVLFCQQSGISSLWKLALLVHKCQDVQWLHCNQLQSFFIVDELNVLPVDFLVVVLILNSSHKYNLMKASVYKQERIKISYWTDSTHSRTIQWFYSAQRLELFAWCVRLSRLLVSFQTHFKSMHFHFISLHTVASVKQMCLQQMQKVCIIVYQMQWSSQHFLHPSTSSKWPLT